MALAAQSSAVGQQIAALCAQGGSPSAASVQMWQRIVAQIYAGIVTGAVVMPTALVAPSGGGPVTGAGTVT